MRWDGHTHSEFCPHGSGEDTEVFIRQAIAHGITHYSITEHAPLPPEFLKRCAGATYARDTAGIQLDQVEPYLKKMTELQHRFQADIRIYIGFEIDYLPDFEDWTRSFLNEYGNFIEDSILSLHFLRGRGGYRAIDYSAEDYSDGLISFYGSFQQAQTAYYHVLRQSVAADLGRYKPKRIGHISLCRKFQSTLSAEESAFSAESRQVVSDLLEDMVQEDYSLDYNTAGLFKPLCGEPYPPDEITQEAINRGIALVFGSDAHRSKAIGGGYDKYRYWEAMAAQRKRMTHGFAKKNDQS
ncbi:MAG: histidinol-phosphatase HisJ [Sporolactobacillus sp.]